MQALAIGNGESRRNIDISSFQNHTLIGCNAIHREFQVDHLICCDQRMVREAVENPNTINTTIYVRDLWYHYFRKIRKNKNISLLPDLPYKGDRRHDQPIYWGSGCYAVLLAALLEHREVSMIGFDLYAREDRVNNIYKGTANYAGINSSPVDPAYWVYQIGQVFHYFPDTIFNIYNFREWSIPKDWQKNNVQLIPINIDTAFNTSYNNSSAVFNGIHPAL